MLALSPSSLAETTVDSEKNHPCLSTDAQYFMEANEQKPRWVFEVIRLRSFYFSPSELSEQRGSPSRW